MREKFNEIVNAIRTLIVRYELDEASFIRECACYELTVPPCPEQWRRRM